MDESRQPSPTFNVKNTSMQQVEPNVDFELDIKVTVSSGQCVLHPKESRTLLDYDDPKRYERHLPEGHNFKKLTVCWCDKFSTYLQPMSDACQIHNFFQIVAFKPWR